MNTQVTSSKPNSIFGDASWNLLYTFWSSALTFLITPMLIRQIGENHYGLYVLLMSSSGLMGVVNMGLGAATLRFVANYYSNNDLEGINRVVGSTLFIYIGSGLLGLTVLFLGAPEITKILSVPDEDIKLVESLFRLTAINFGIGLWTGVLDAIPKALQRYDINAKVLIVQSTLQVFGSAGIIILKKGVFDLVAWSVIVVLITIIINYRVARKLIPGIKLFPAFSKAGITEVLSYGIFTIITQTLGLIWGYVDRLLLGSLVSSSSVAYLSVPQSTIMKGSSAVISAGSVLFPRFSSTLDTARIQKLFLDSTWALLVSTIVIFVPATILVPDLLRLWIGQEFADASSRIGQIIAFSCIFRGAFVPYDSLFKGIGKPAYLTYLYLATGITSVITNIILIPLYGLEGAGYSYVITIFWGFATIVFAWRKVLVGGSLAALFRSVVVPIILGLVLLPCFEYFRSLFSIVGWIDLVVIGLLFLVVTLFIVVLGDLIIQGKKSHIFVILSSSIIRKLPLIEKVLNSLGC